jgi:hypothetical protein
MSERVSPENGESWLLRPSRESQATETRRQLLVNVQSVSTTGVTGDSERIKTDDGT